MATIVTRSGKGSPLTNTEVDANFTNLNTELGTKADASSLATVATTGAYADLTGKPTNVSSFSNDSGYITGITSSNVTTALGYTPYNATNPSGYITSSALTPYALKTGAAFTGAISSTGSVTAPLFSATSSGAGSVYLNAGTASNTGYISFWNAAAVRQSYIGYSTANNNLTFQAEGSTGFSFNKTVAVTGSVTASVDMRAPIFYDSDNTAYYVDPASTSVLKQLEIQNGGSGNLLFGVDSGNDQLTIKGQNYSHALNLQDSYNTTNYARITGGFTTQSLITLNGYSAQNTINKTSYYGSDYSTVAGIITGTTDVRAPIFYDSNDTSYYVDAASTSNLNAANFNGAVNLNGGATIWTGSTGLRLKRNPTSATGDDVLDIQVFDAEARFTLDNDNDGDNSLFTFGHTANSARVQTLAFDDVNISWKGQKIFHDSYHPEADKWTTARTLSLSGDATGSVSWDGSANVTLPVAVVNDSHEHSFNSLLNKTGGTGTYTTSGDFRAPVFYDSNNTAYGVDPTGFSNLTTLYADRYFQRASGIPTANLGDPTVTEMALFDRQFNNKTAFYPSANLKFFTSTDGVTWTEYTSFTDGMKKAFLGGDATSGVFIPNATPYFRIELTNDGNYVYLNALYIYWSASGNSSTVKIQKRRASDDAWLQHTNSSTAVAGWPSHLYLPFATIPYISPTSTSSGHFDTINIDFQPTWANANNIALYNMEIWGGYPAGSRNIYSTDSDKNVTFPTILTANTDVRSNLFRDSADTAFFVDPASTSNLTGLTVANTITGSITGNAATATTLQTARTISLAGDATGSVSFNGSANVSITAEVVDDSHAHSFNNLLNKGSGTGTYTTSGDYRAPIFYDSNDTTYYTNPNSTSNLLGLSVTNRITGSISGDAQRLFSHTGANNGGLQYWNTLDNTTLNPSAGYHYGLRMAHGDADTYYNATIAVDFFADNFYLRRKAGGTDQTWRRFWHNGDSTVSATGDFRAPIFYDSDNTGFYADFASANANAVYTNGGYSISAGDGKGFRFWNDDSYKIYMSASSNATWGGRVSGETTSDYNMYFRMSGGTNRGFVFRNGTTNVAGIDSTGRIFTGGGRIYLNDATTNFIIAQAGTSSALYLEARGGGFRVRNAGNGDSWFTALDGTCTATTDFRAPIFYDSANTGFYVDPASTSNLSALNVNGSAVYRSDWTTRFQSGSDFVDGTLVTTDIPATATNGDSFVIEITGKSYDGSNPPFKVIAQGYIYNDTIINYSGISYAGNFASYIKVFQDGGVLKFWWPRISYWNSFNVNVMTMDAASNGTITRNRVTAIGNSTEPTGTKKQQINLKGFMRNDVSATNSVDVRAPIFYDSNNTGFYIDPNSTSNLLGLTVANTITGSVSGSSGSTTGNAATATTLQTARTINGVSFNGSANITVADSTKLPLAGGTMTGTLTMATQTALVASNYGHGVYGVYSAERYQHVWSMGTGYNLPADGLSSGNGGSLYGLAWSYNPNYGYTGSNAQSKAGLNHQLLLMMNGITYFAAGNGVWTSGTGTSTSDWRAPIFYDSNDTAFYIDPNSISHLNDVRANVYYQRDDTNNRFDTGVLALRSASPTVYFRDTDNNSAMLHCNSNLFYVLRGGNDTETWATVNGHWPLQINLTNNDAQFGGVLTAITDMRAPIFYDSNNTGFYLDPNSTSNVSTLNAVNINVSSQAAFAGGSYVATNGDVYARRSSGTTGVYYFADGGSKYLYWDGGSYIFGSAGGVSATIFSATSDMRAPIYYDYNNTAFYLDPHSTATSLNVAGSIIAAGNVTAYSDIRIKANVETIPDALDKLDQIRGVTYTRTDLDDKEQRYAGVIAQEIEKVLPEAVRDLGNIKAVDYNATIGLLIQAVKELRDEVEAMKSRLH